MTIVNELNKLAEKITGTNPKATTDKKALDFIADYYAQENLKPTTNAQAIKNITDNYTSGGGGGEEYHNEYILDLDKETYTPSTEEEYDIDITNNDNLSMLATYREEILSNPKGAKSSITIKFNNQLLEGSYNAGIYTVSSSSEGVRISLGAQEDYFHISYNDDEDAPYVTVYPEDY